MTMHHKEPRLTLLTATAIMTHDSNSLSSVYERHAELPTEGYAYGDSKLSNRAPN
jgi:hypothetical protein